MGSPDSRRMGRAPSPKNSVSRPSGRKSAQGTTIPPLTWPSLPGADYTRSIGSPRIDVPRVAYPEIAPLRETIAEMNGLSSERARLSNGEGTDPGPRTGVMITARGP
jgi:hypothetical protein